MKSSHSVAFMAGKPLQDTSTNTTITRERSTGADCVDVSEIAKNDQALQGGLSIAGEGISHGGERWQECRSQGDTKQNGFVFGA